MHKREVWRMCCINSGPGSKLACTLSESEGDDLMAPVIVSNTVLCVCLIFFAVPVDPRSAVLVSAL